MLTPELIPHKNIIINFLQFLELVVFEQLLLLVGIIMFSTVLQLFLLLLLVLSKKEKHVVKTFHVYFFVDLDIFGESVA